MKEKVYIAERSGLDRDMIGRKFRIVDDPRAADIGLAWKKDIEGIPPERTVMCQSEPPITEAYRSVYSKSEAYHTIVRFDPDPEADNEFPFSESPHMFPYAPGYKYRLDIDTSGEGIYFAGKHFVGSRPEKDGYSFGYPHMYGLRRRIASRLRSEFGGHCLGRGWGQATKDPKDTSSVFLGKENNWHARKFVDIGKYNPMFVVSVENSRIPGYLSEKFWDGLLSGRPMVYLGAPETPAPPSTYIDAGEYWNDGIDIDMDGLVSELEGWAGDGDGRMEMCSEAREWMESTRGIPREQRVRCTELVMERINGRA